MIAADNFTETGGIIISPSYKTPPGEYIVKTLAISQSHNFISKSAYLIMHSLFENCTSAVSTGTLKILVQEAKTPICEQNKALEVKQLSTGTAKFNIQNTAYDDAFSFKFFRLSKDGLYKQIDDIKDKNWINLSPSGEITISPSCNTVSGEYFLQAFAGEKIEYNLPSDRIHVNCSMPIIVNERSIPVFQNVIHKINHSKKDVISHTQFQIKYSKDDSQKVKYFGFKNNGNSWVNMGEDFENSGKINILQDASVKPGTYNVNTYGLDICGNIIAEGNIDIIIEQGFIEQGLIDSLYECSSLG